jgi:hypothetical protein
MSVPSLFARPPFVKAELMPVPGYPGYFASQSGDVWSCRVFRGSSALRRLVASMDGQSKYLTVKLCTTNRKNVGIHRAVLLAHVGLPPAGKALACHCNGCKTDNRLSNLRWDSVKANAHDMLKHGTQKVGESAARAKLSETQVYECARLKSEGVAQCEMARRFGVSVTTISDIFVGRTWRHLGFQSRGVA